MKVTNEKELGEALKNGEDYIEIEGDIANKTIKIKATGKIAWIVAIGAIGVAVVGVLSAPATGGAGIAASGIIAAPVAASVLGVGVTTSAITIAVAAGSVGALNKLRKYKMTKISDSHIILSKK